MTKQRRILVLILAVVVPAISRATAAGHIRTVDFVTIFGAGILSGVLVALALQRRAA